MRIKPGDHVVIPFMRPVSAGEAVRIREHLRDVMPGVRWGLIDGTPLTHALVYEAADPDAPDLQAKLTTALDLLDLVVGRFLADNPGDEWASGMARQIEVGQWQQWIADARRMT